MGASTPLRMAVTEFPTELVQTTTAPGIAVICCATKDNITGT